METNEANSNDIVHPEVRAHINSLVSALGGASTEDEGRYKLGDDALEVLRDIKKWIRFYDEKTNRMDVARCLAEANIVGSDLLQILALWTENESNNKFRARIALACLEVMVPLTWPIEKEPETMTVNHHRHIPVLQLAQLGYKRAIINFDGASILHTAVRLALPSLALPIGDRAPRDQGIIKLVLFFLRNMAMISPQPGVKYEGDESQISRSATIDAFSYQDIFIALLTIASNMGEDFRTEDVIIMETIYHLVKRVDSQKLFLNDKELSRAKANELTAMLNKEKAMLRAHNKNAPTRHNRFGTMIWVKREDGKLATVTGQEALLNPALRESKMDESKTFRPPRRSRKDDMEPKDLGPRPSLNPRANDQLRSFVEDFLDSGFNPLFQHVRKSIDREAPHVMGYHRAQFFYLVAWFLEAERMRRKSKRGRKPVSSVEDVGSFNLVAGVLNQEMFITLNRSLDRAYNDKDWQELTTVMRCFTQTLLTVQEMTETGNEEDEEIADNILSRLFYEETVHDAVTNIVRTYKDQGFEYLDACTELVHNYLRILEAYSKQNLDLQVRSRKRSRRKKKTDQAVQGEGEENRGEGDESADDEADAERTSRERKFDFKRFANRFIPQGVVDTFVKFTRYYRDLDDAQLKRAHRYFYRIAFKQEMSVMLFRVDIIQLFYSMIKGQEPLDKNSSMFKEWEELAKQIIKKCVRKIEERPALITELLFSKINSTAHYLEFGFEKQTISSNPRAGAELDFRRGLERDQQIAIAVGVLLDKSQSDHLEWIKKQLMDCESERRAWEAVDQAQAAMQGGADRISPSNETQEPAAASTFTVRADSDLRRTAMFKNSHLRLLMRLVGIERLAPSLDETPESVWVIPGELRADAIQDSLDLIKKAEFSPPTFEDGELAADQLKRKTAPRKRAAFDDDDDDMSGLIDDGGVLFPAGKLESRKPDYEAAKKGTRRRRRRNSDAEEPTEDQLDEKARARRQKELEKLRKIKSEMYVHASDDETDDERDRAFFENEQRRQKAKDATFGWSSTSVLDTGKSAWEKILDGDGDDDQLVLTQQDEEAAGDKAKGGAKKSRKRKSKVELASSDDESEALSGRRRAKKSRSSKTMAESSDEEDAASSQTMDGDEPGDRGAEMDTDDTPLSSSPHLAAAKDAEAPAAANKHSGEAAALDEDDDDEDGLPVVAPPRARARARAGFIVDSSDEE